MKNTGLTAFALEYNAYPDSKKLTTDPFTVNLGEVVISFNMEKVWNEEDYLASFALRFLFAVAALKDTEEVYVDHHDSSGFIKMVKSNGFVILSLGRGDYLLTQNFKIYNKAKIDWKQLLEETVSVTQKFLDWTKENWTPFLDTGRYQTLQKKLSEVKKIFDIS